MALFLFLPSLAHAATRNVPSQYPTMQAAINAAAVSGDTVLVADGTYTGSGNRDLDFLGKSLTFRSVNGAARTVIDCQGTAAAPHRGFYIHQNEASVVIDGFTVRNGYVVNASGGGAFIHSNVSATITNCIFSNNAVKGTPDSGAGGGGLFVNGGTNSVTVTNCTFSGNYANNGGGGALIFSEADTGNTTVTNCTFSGNKANSGAGGGAGFNGNNVTLTSCAFSGNGAFAGDSGGGGGGAFVYATNRATVTNCAFSGNAANGNVSSSAVGGGAYVFGNIATVTNCTFSRNAVSSSNGGGGAFVSSDSSTTLTNCTFSGNAVNGNASAGVTGGGGAYVYSSGGSETVKNCIAWGDAAPTGKEIYFNSDAALSVSLTFSDIQGGAASAVASKGSFTYVSNINADPRFVNAAAGDLHLQPLSPCIGKGTLAGAPATDKDGKTRPNPPSMGAYDVVFALQSLTLSPASVFGGQSSTGTVTLTRPAPAGGTKVLLASNTGYAIVPSSVTVAAGATSKTFSVASNPVATIKAATISASFSGVTKMASLLIYAPALVSLTLNPTTVKGGQFNSAATVTLTSPAPAGGTVVFVGSNTGYAVVPSSVTVPAGAKVVVFTVVTKPVSANKGATITATLANVSKSAGLLLTP